MSSATKLFNVINNFKPIESFSNIFKRQNVLHQERCYGNLPVPQAFVSWLSPAGEMNSFHEISLMDAITFRSICLYNTTTPLSRQTSFVGRLGTATWKNCFNSPFTRLLSGQPSWQSVCICVTLYHSTVGTFLLANFHHRSTLLIEDKHTSMLKY